MALERSVSIGSHVIKSLERLGSSLNMCNISGGLGRRSVPKIVKSISELEVMCFHDGFIRLRISLFA